MRRTGDLKSPFGATERDVDGEVGWKVAKALLSGAPRIEVLPYGSESLLFNHVEEHGFIDFLSGVVDHGMDVAEVFL